LLNHLLVAAMPITPRFIVRSFSKAYIAGEDTDAALGTCKDLQSEGFVTTLDILGESVSSEEQANRSADGYRQLIEAVVDADVERNISLKPTALGLAVSEDLAFRNIESIVSRAADHGMFIRIDMENSPYTDQTLAFYKTLQTRYSNVGTVIQAYLKRSMADVEEIAGRTGNLRICKGIYRESPQIAYQQRDEISDHFHKLVETMLKQQAYVGIATHDVPLMNRCLESISALGIGPERYEFQALLGVPIRKELNQLLQDGHKVRIYVPFGKEWYAYASRRLKENPNIAGYVMKDFFKRQVG